MKKLVQIFIGRIKKNFDRLNDSLLDQRGKDVLSALTGSLIYPDPPPLVDLDAALKTFAADITGANTGDTSKVKIKNDSRLALIAILKSLANYVTYVADGSVALLSQSGFELVQVAGASVVTKPTGVIIIPGDNKGTFKIIVKGAKGVRSLIYEYTTDPLMAEDSWTGVPATTKKILLTGLTSKAEYYIRVALIGSKGQIVYSDVIAKVAM